MTLKGIQSGLKEEGAFGKTLEVSPSQKTALRTSDRKQVRPLPMSFVYRRLVGSRENSSAVLSNPSMPPRCYFHRVFHSLKI